MKSVRVMIHKMRLILLLCITIFSVNTQVIHAQTDNQPVYEGDTIVGNMGWDADSRWIYFQEFFDGNSFGVNPEIPQQWIGYDTVTDQLQRFDPWPLQPTLTAIQMTDFEVATANGIVSFVFPSPNGRYIVYAAQKPPQALDGPLGIADLQTGEHIVIDSVYISRIDAYETSWRGYYRVRWSADSSAFIIETNRPVVDSTLYYVSNFSTDVSNTSVEDLTHGGTMVSGELVNPYLGYDISHDGDEVLFKLGVPFAGYSQRLVIWNHLNGTSRVIQGVGLILEAKWDEQHPDAVVFIDERGLVRYDLNSDMSEILNPDLSSTIINLAWISPDTQQIAIFVQATANRGELYIYDIPATDE